jgi:hypothetical protein
MRSTKPGEGTRRAAARRVLLRLVFAAAAAGSLGAINITVSGSWSAVLDVSNLQGGPGTDFLPVMESPLDVVTMDIKQAQRQDWQVTVRRIDGIWPSDLALSVKRTSNGKGNGTISGGTSYQSVTAVDQPFFSGYRNRTNVSLRFQLSGLSVKIPPSAYTTTIVYTVVQTI